MVLRTRIALALISIAVIGLEITLMRVLALRFWHHFAAMVISVALLGFGCSGTLLTLLQSRLRPQRRMWLSLFGFGSCLSALGCTWAVQRILLDVHYLAWDPGTEIGHILQIEFLMMVPFLMTGAFLGLALMDHPDRVHGHYAANLAGSGAGAVACVALMAHSSTGGLLVVWSLLCCAAGLCLTDRQRTPSVAAAVVTVAVLLPAAWLFPAEVQMSPYKKLSLEKSKPGTRVMRTRTGPLGRIDWVKGPAIHDAPAGMSLNNPYRLPGRSLLTVDGDRSYILYDVQAQTQWRFLDYTTTALPFFVAAADHVLIVGSGAGAPLALARRHQSQTIDALEPNRQLVELIDRHATAQEANGYRGPGINLSFEQVRSHLAGSHTRYDLILVPLLDAAGSGATGLGAAQENYLYTLQSMGSFLRHLKQSGMLCVTVYAQTPPRDGLRLFNLAVEALNQENRSARNRLALIRSWETVTLLVSNSPLTADQIQKIRAFAESRGFDLCYLPGLAAGQANRYHVLAAPYYFQAAQELLGQDRSAYVRDYLFNLSAPTDDRPYFNHFMRWGRLQDMRRQFKGTTPAYVELGSLLLAAALSQVAILAAVLIVLPLFSKTAGLRQTPKKGMILIYFFLLGAGFMLLEMSFLQKMILYLGHPIYSAATVIAAFLIFSGFGSQASRMWFNRPGAAIAVAGLLTATLSGLYLIGLDPWLAWSQGLPLAARFGIAGATVAPLAFAMGHMFPLGLGWVGKALPALVPWSWASNGFASVLAAAGAPLAAMSVGFSRLIIAAMVCYALAAALFALRIHRGV
jgi:hypothetical protein